MFLYFFLFSTEKVKELEEKNFVLQADVEEKDSKLYELKTFQEDLQQKISQMQINLDNTQKELQEKSGEKTFDLIMNWF